MKLPNLSDNQKKKIDCYRLGWWILEQKLMYYNPEYGKCVSDELYDAEEIKYKDACEDLGLEPTASNNVGFPWDTPSGRLVVSKFGKKPPKNVVTQSSIKPIETVRVRTRTRTRPEKPRIRKRPKGDNVKEVTKRVRKRPRKRSF